MMREPTCRISGRFAAAPFSSNFNSSGCISWAVGIVVAANGGADCDPARDGNCIMRNASAAIIPVVATDVIFILESPQPV
jgi:hypothetical protein